MTARLVRVVAPHFVAGLVASGGQVTEAAPILRWAVGWETRALARYFRRRGWSWTWQPDPAADCAT